MRTALLSWMLLPVYLWQGVGVRRRVERLLPPTGMASGAVGAARQGDARLQLLVLGDSSAAGIGVEHMEQSLAPRLAERLSVLTGLPVAWRAAGSNSAVSAEIRDFVVPNLAPVPYTHILLSAGTNDVKNFHTARRFKRAFGGLLYALRARWPDAQIVWSPPVDMKRVPALPRGLAKVLDLRSRVLAPLGRRLCQERGVVAATTLPRVEPAGFSRDGFHASAEGASYVAEHLASYLVGERSSPAA